MTRTTITRLIDASIDNVFRTVSDISQYSQAVPYITKIEYLSDKKTGVGTRFQETRLVKGKESVTEYIENDRVRLVADSHGTVWDTVFTVRAENMQTELSITMDAKAYQLLPKLINPLIKGMVKKTIVKDMDSVKLSGSDLEEIRKTTDFAKQDFRDILTGAEYPRQSKKWSLPDGPKKQKLVDADRADYEEWLGI